MCNDLEFYFKPIVLVTGFGPFVNHPVNASWEAVKLLDKVALEARHRVELVQLELPVTYSNVDEFVPALWETHEPKLMIHVGVSSIAQCLTLETQAHRKGYLRQDYLEECPAGGACATPGAGAVRLHTRLDVDRICNQFNQNAEENVSAVSSNDAGRYLCEYIYYTSLSVDNTRTLFVHVPDLAVYPAARTARALERVLDLCLEQLRERDPSSEQLRERDPSSEQLRERDPSSEQLRERDPSSEQLRERDPSSEQLRERDPSSEQLREREDVADRLAGASLHNGSASGDDNKV